MTPHADKRYVGYLRSIKDPVAILLKLVREVGPMHTTGNEAALFRQAQRVVDEVKCLSNRARGAKRRAAARV